MKNATIFSKKYIFCPECGEPLGKLIKNLLKCKNKHHFYINPRPTTGIILENEKDEILLVKREVNPNKGYWDIPGGFVDLFENAENSLVREVNEELGITLTEFKYLFSKYDLYEYGTLIYPALGLIYHAKIKKQKFTPNDDISGYEWFEKDKIPYRKLAFENLKKVFKEFTKQ